ncbi:MAG TPA: chlorite dismutase family protein [Anaerolineales bacterium]|nr:chlorite dismutase family protein [Anaerolineales bacterium]
MATEPTRRSLNHIGLFRFRDGYWRLQAGEKAAALGAWLGALERACERLHLYQVFPTEAGSDFLLWGALPSEKDEDAAAFFETYGRATYPHRQLLDPVTFLWGYTAASVYSKARSAQEIDPFGDTRKRYLVVYPFNKTGPWYLKSAEARQGMMNEHIRLGKQFTQIHQLLLYSFGLQDHEFVVVYETDDLPQFSDLVRQLRSTEVRLYTALDAPLHTAVYLPREKAMRLWTG